MGSRVEGDGRVDGRVNDERGEASGDDLKRAPVAPARGRRSGCMARLYLLTGAWAGVRRRRGGGEGGEESGEGETLT